MASFSRIRFVLVLTFTTLFSCSDPKTDKENGHERLVEIVQKQNALLESYFKKADAGKLASLYTVAAKLSPDGHDFIQGRDSLKAFWEKDFKSSRLIEMKTNVITTDGTEDVIYETGKTTTKTLYMDSVYTGTVKYINVWIKQPDGTYQLDIDFWNDDK